MGEKAQSLDREAMGGRLEDTHFAVSDARLINLSRYKITTHQKGLVLPD